MGIYRGAGGSTDATQDASSEARIAVQARDDALAYKNAAALSATAAATSATSASTSATSATSSASSATSSATSASTSATTATTQANIATTKASEAAISATNASTSATSAATSATNASNSATSAATSATNAATSATNASSSAFSASVSAINSSLAYNNFHNQYQGSYSAAPTLRPDSTSLQAGDLYFNTSSNSMKVYNGSTWVDAYASLSGALVATNNLSDLNNTATARSNLGLATVASSGSTTDLTEGTKLFYTDTRARASISGSTGLSYNATTGVMSCTITQYTDALARAAVSATAPITYSAGVFSMAAATTSVNGYLTSTDWNTFNGKQPTLVSGTSIKTVNSTSLLGAGNIAVGTVTSVTGTAPITVATGTTTPAISLAAAYGDTINPYASKTANFILAAPNGAAGVPTFRAIVAADIPTLNQNTTGSAGSVLNSLTIGSGLRLSSGTTYNGSAALTLNAIGTTLNSQTAAYVVAASDAGKLISITTGGVTVNNSVMSAGDIITIYNNSAASQTIIQGTGVTLQWAGQASSTTGNRTLGLYGMATIVFLSASSAVITGSGLT